VAIGVHFPGDVLAGALVGITAALLLWLRPIRTWIDALADKLGAPIERVLSWGGERLRFGPRS
jgi:membrane-associated phospholipid phosphatase